MPPAPVSFVQPTLLEATRTLHPRGYKRLAQRADPQLSAWTDQFTVRRAALHNWSIDTLWRVRNGVDIVLGFQTTPGTTIAATDIDILAQAKLPVAHVTTVLEDAGLLHDDRIPAVIRWSERSIAHLPPAMTEEIRTWLTIMREGTTTHPRRRPRTETTIRLHLSWSLPALTHWAANGKTSLREITPDDVHSALPPTGATRTRTGQGLRSLFHVLRASRLLFTNPTAQIPTGQHPSTTPMPLPVQHIQEALNSPDQARALLTALLVFHGLSAHQAQHLKLTDLHDHHLTLDTRRVLLADPVLHRLDAYLEHRTSHWPATHNPHLFIHFRNAHTTEHVGKDWANQRLGPRLTPRALRDDRLLNEVHAGGDTRRLIALFGLSTKSAQRYTTTHTHQPLRRPPATAQSPPLRNQPPTLPGPVEDRVDPATPKHIAGK